MKVTCYTHFVAFDDDVIYLEAFKVGAKARVHNLIEDTMENFTVSKVICRSDDPDWYDKQNDADLDKLHPSAYCVEFVEDDEIYYVFLN